MTKGPAWVVEIQKKYNTLTLDEKILKLIQKVKHAKRELAENIGTIEILLEKWLDGTASPQEIQKMSRVGQSYETVLGAVELSKNYDDATLTHFSVMAFLTRMAGCTLPTLNQSAIAEKNYVLMMHKISKVGALQYRAIANEKIRKAIDKMANDEAVSSGRTGTFFLVFCQYLFFGQCVHRQYNLF